MQSKVKVGYMADKITKARLRWFGHVKRSCAYVLARRCERLVAAGVRREKGMPKNWGA